MGYNTYVFNHLPSDAYRGEDIMTKKLISEYYESNEDNDKSFITHYIYNCTEYNKVRIGFLVSDDTSFEIQLTRKGYTLEVMNGKSYPPKYRIWFDDTVIQKG